MQPTDRSRQDQDSSTGDGPYRSQARSGNRPYHREGISGNDAVDNNDQHYAEPDYGQGQYKHRQINPGDEIVAHHYQDDNETVLTDLQTIEYEANQPTLFPSAARDMSSSDSDDDEHPALGTIAEEDSRSHATPASGSVPYTPGMDQKMPAKTLNDPNWKGQSNSDVNNLPNKLPATPPTISYRQYDDQGRAHKEQLKSNPDAIASVGAHAKQGTAAAAAAANPASNLLDELSSETQPIPAPRPTRPNFEYDSRGRATKASMAQDDARVGAYAIAGPALLSAGRRQLANNGPEEVREENRSNDPSEAADAHTGPVQVSEVTIPTRPFWQQKMFVAGAVVLIVIIVVMMAVLAATGGGGEEEQTIPASETDAPTEAYMAPIPGLLEATLIDIDTPATVANQAYEFSIGDPNWNSYEDWRRQQRFALACAFYAFGGRLIGNSQVRISPLFYNMNECEWVTSSIKLCPGDDGIVRFLKVLKVKWGLRSSIPPEIALLSNLETLDIVESRLVSMEELLPLDVPNSLASLKSLIMVNCDTAGSIPSMFGVLTSLTRLDIMDNGLTSRIPSELGLLSNLTSVILTRNSLTGAIPEELGDLPSLDIFEAEENDGLEPPIPSGFCSQNRTAWQSITTDWCSNPTQCCTL